MAGAGYKLFNTGDVLTAAQVNTYLQEQAVMRFANAAARTTALSGVLAEGMVSYLMDTDTVEVYNGSAWVSIGSSGDITGITTGATSGLTGGVTSGTADLKLNTTAKGGLLVGTGSGTVTELSVGTNTHVLTADSSTASGLKWAAASGGLTYTNIATSATSPLPDITNGNATIIHRYAQSGKFVHQFLQFTWGSTTTISSGASLLTLTPAVTAASGYSIFAVGTALFYDSSANQVFLGRLRMDGQAIYLYAEDDLGSYLRTVNTTNTVPMTWATGDVITVNAFYEAA